MVGNLDIMFGARYSEKVDRPKCESLMSTALNREFDLLAAIAPCAVIVFDLESPEVRCARTEEYNCLVTLDGHLRSNDIGRPFDPVAPGGPYEVWRVIGPVRLSVSIPSVVSEYLVVKHNER